MSFALTWPETLYAAVFQTRLEMPSDAADTIEYVLSTLNEMERYVLLCRLKEGMTLEETSKRDGLTKERIRQIELKALRKLRHPAKLRCLEIGLHEQQKFDSIAFEEASKIKVEALSLSVRSYNALVRNGAHTLADIASFGGKIRSFRNLGNKSYEEIRLKCADYGVILPPIRFHKKKEEAK